MTINNLKERFYHGTRADFKAGDLIQPEATEGCLYLTRNMDEAIWDAELAAGDDPARVYIVEPTGRIEDLSDHADPKPRGRPTMSIRSFEPLRVNGEVTDWQLYHGTRADLKPGDLIEPGYFSNFGVKQRKANYVYMSRTLDAATWGAELAVGDGAGRIYIVEPTGLIEDDPNLTDKKFRGNPSKSFRSRMPLRVTGEIKDWRGHSAEAVAAMKEGIRKLEEQGIEAEDD